MTKLDDDPTRLAGESHTDQAIIKTLVKCASTGLEPQTVRTISDKLNYLSQHADLFKPEQVKAYIATATAPKKPPDS